jgi:hypothetical protein
MILTRLFYGNIVLVCAIIIQFATFADKICCFTRLWTMVFQNALQIIAVTWMASFLHLVGDENLQITRKISRKECRLHTHY